MIEQEDSVEYTKLEQDLLTEKYTTVYAEKDFQYNAPHSFMVIKTEDKDTLDVLDMDEVLGWVKFQEGPIKEAGVNGVMNEDLIAMVIDRLEHFNNSEFSCRENSMAITKLEEALLWLRKRTMGRESKGIEGTHHVDSTGEVKEGHFTKKPIEIQAYQWTGKATEANTPLWIDKALEENLIGTTKVKTLRIETLEGIMEAQVGDYIVKGIQGELYPVKKDIFEQSYDVSYE